MTKLRVESANYVTFDGAAAKMLGNVNDVVPEFGVEEGRPAEQMRERGIIPIPLAVELIGEVGVENP